MKTVRSVPILLTLSVLLLASLACSLAGGAAPTQPPAPPAPTQQVSTPVVEPPTTAPPVPQDTPTAEPPPPTPTEEVQQFFTEEFDNGTDSWSPFVTNGELSQLDFSAKDSRLSFDLKEKQLWTYALYTPQSYTDVRIDTKVDNLGQNENNISLICRYNKDRGWYEFSVANSGLYWIYFGKWDSSGSTASYAVIADGGSNNIKQGLATNTYAMTWRPTPTP